MKYVPHSINTRYHEDENRSTTSTFRTPGKRETLDSLIGKDEYQEYDTDGLKIGNKVSQAVMIALPTLIMIAATVLFFLNKVDTAMLLLPAVFLVASLLALIFGNGNPDPTHSRNFRVGAAVVLVVCTVVLGIMLIRNLGFFKFGEYGFLRIMSVAIFVIALTGLIGNLVFCADMNKRCTTMGIATVIGFEDKIHNVWFDSVLSMSSTALVHTMPVYRLDYNNHSYAICFNEDIIDIQKMPYIGSTKPVYFDPENPYDCMETKRASAFNSLMKYIIALFVLAATMGLSFFATEIDRSYLEKYDKGIITDDYIKYELLSRSERNREFTVYERVVSNKTDGAYYFDEVGGIGYSAIIDMDLDIGDSVIWIQIKDGDFYLVDMDDYEYEGDHTIENSPYYSDEGKFYLTDDYIAGLLGTDDFHVCEVYLDQIYNNELVFFDAYRTGYTLRSSNESYINYINLYIHGGYYYAYAGNKVMIFSMAQNEYHGVRTQINN